MIFKVNQSIPKVPYIRFFGQFLELHAFFADYSENSKHLFLISLVVFKKIETIINNSGLKFVPCGTHLFTQLFRIV